MYLVYKTTNIVNGKFYVGVHKTNNINDSYLGSGKLLKYAIRKYGKENFVREVLYVFDSKRDAYLKEQEIVNSVFLIQDVYNLKKGGEGGWDHVSKLRENEEFKKKVSKTLSRVTKKSHENGILPGWKSWKGKKRKPFSSDHKKKMSQNSWNKLTSEIIESRRNDYFNIEKKNGWITDLTKKWKISHTQVKRFIKKYVAL